MDELFCLPGFLQGAGEAAAGEKLTWESHRCQITLCASSHKIIMHMTSHAINRISTSSLPPARFLSASHFTSRLFYRRGEYFSVVLQRGKLSSSFLSAALSLRLSSLFVLCFWSLEKS